MSKLNYSITFACYNQVDYTKQCIDSIVKHGYNLKNLVVVDNGSTDETRSYLATLPLGGLILNEQNLGCGVAWNQGALTLQTEWTIIMNNDVIVSEGFVENLITVAEKNNLKVISPALIEGELDYNFEEFSSIASGKMQEHIRLGARHAVCLLIHKSVWMEVGFFQPIPKLLGYEDTMFFNELDKANIQTAICGAAWLHHYGSITQNAMKQERGLSKKQGLPYRYNYRLLKQSWLERKLRKMQKIRREKCWMKAELEATGMSLYGIRKNNAFIWK